MVAVGAGEGEAGGVGDAPGAVGVTRGVVATTVGVGVDAYTWQAVKLKASATLRATNVRFIVVMLVSFLAVSWSILRPSVLHYPGQ